MSHRPLRRSPVKRHREVPRLPRHVRLIGGNNIMSSSLHEALVLEQSLLQQIEASRQAHLEFEQAALAELEAAWAPATAEAAQAGLDLDTYAAALAEAADLEAAGAGQVDPAVLEAMAAEEAAAAGMDLESYVAMLAQLEAAELEAQQAGAPDA